MSDTTENGRDLSSRLQELLDEVEEDPSTSPSVPTSTTTPDIGTLLSQLTGGQKPSGMSDPSPLSALMQNPQLMAQLPTLLGVAGKMLGGTGGAQGTQSPSGGKKYDRHTALLLALKPYLGEDRRRAADEIIRLCRIWDMIKVLPLGTDQNKQ